MATSKLEIITSVFILLIFLIFSYHELFKFTGDYSFAASRTMDKWTSLRIMIEKLYKFDFTYEYLYSLYKFGYGCFYWFFYSVTSYPFYYNFGDQAGYQFIKLITFFFQLGGTYLLFKGCCENLKNFRLPLLIFYIFIAWFSWLPILKVASVTPEPMTFFFISLQIYF